MSTACHADPYRATGATMLDQITGERLTSLFRPRSVALVGASDKSAFSMLAYRNLVEFGFGSNTYLVSRRGTPAHGQPTVTSCAQITEPVDVAYLMVPQAGLLGALDDAAAAGIRNACVLSSGYAEAGEAGRAAQAELAAHAASLGMVLLGPEPSRLRQLHRRRAGLLHPRPAPGARAGIKNNP